MNILVLQISSNDLTQKEPHELMCSLLIFLEHVQQQHGIKRMVIMEILYHRHTHQYLMQMDIGTYNSIVGAANQQLKTQLRRSYF